MFSLVLSTARVQHIYILIIDRENSKQEFYEFHCGWI